MSCAATTTEDDDGDAELEFIVAAGGIGTKVIHAGKEAIVPPFSKHASKPWCDALENVVPCVKNAVSHLTFVSGSALLRLKTPSFVSPVLTFCIACDPIYFSQALHFPLVQLL